MTKVIVVIGPGSIGQAIARRVGAGKHLLLADLRQENADAAAKTLSEAGFEVTTTTVDVSSRGSVEALVVKASSLGDVHGVIHAAGVSPSQAAPETILSSGRNYGQSRVRGNGCEAERRCLDLRSHDDAAALRGR